MAVEIIFTVNSGMLINSGNTSILVDSIYGKEGRDLFSRPNKGLMRDMLNGEPPFDKVDAFLFTHLHVDHGSPYMISDIKNKNIPVIFPYTGRYERGFRDVKNPKIYFDFTDKKEQIVNIGEAKIIGIPTIHAGRKLLNTEHFSLIIELDGKRLLIAGDVSDDDENLAKAVSEREFDVAFVNYSEISREKGRYLINKLIKPKRLFLYHLPLPEDDKHDFLETTRKNLIKYKDDLPEQCNIVRYLSKLVIE